MKEYPKVPRYDHPVVKNEWFGEGAIVLEKYDGSNFRFALYDDVYQEYETIDNANDGDFILGTSSAYCPESEISGFRETLEFESRLHYIDNLVDRDEIRDLHNRYDAPVIFFGENMVRHTLDYNWVETPPLIIFDMYVPKLDDSDDTTYRRYEEEFTGFVSWNTTVNIAENILDMPTARHVQTGVDRDAISPASIGQSEYADGRAEGWVIRNDKQNRRMKIRTPEFRELNQKIWGKSINDDDPESKRIAYEFASSNRIRKEFKKAMNKGGYDISDSLLDYVTRQVVDDIWSEEWEEFADCSFVPYDLYHYVGTRVEGTLSRPDLFGLPNATENVVENWELNRGTLPDPIHPDDPIEHIKNLITDDVLIEHASRVLNNEDKEFGNWIIGSLTDDIRYYIWYECRDDFLRVNVPVDGSRLNDSLYEVTVPFVKSRDSVDR